MKFLLATTAADEKSQQALRKS